MAKRGRKPKKWLPDTVIEEMREADLTTLTGIVIEAVGKVNEIESQQKSDSELDQLQKDAKALKKGYTDAAKYEQAKIKFALELLSDKV